MSKAREAMLRYKQNTLDRMAQEWHEASDHARDGNEFGSPLCNCDRIAERAFNVGWAPDYEKRDRMRAALDELKRLTADDPT